MSTDKNQKLQREKLQARNFTKFGLDMNIFVSVVTAILVLGFIIYTISQPQASAAFFGGINTFINQHFNWLYVVTINGALMYLVFLGFSKYGKIRLGGVYSKA